MKFMSFGDGAGHLMERLLESAGTGEVSPDTVRVQPEAFDAVEELLGEAARGGWILELLGADDEPDQGQGQLIKADRYHRLQLDGFALGGEPVRVAVGDIERIHVF